MKSLEQLAKECKVTLEWRADGEYFVTGTRTNFLKFKKRLDMEMAMMESLTSSA